MDSVSAISLLNRQQTGLPCKILITLQKEDFIRRRRQTISFLGAVIRALPWSNYENYIKYYISLFGKVLTRFFLLTGHLLYLKVFILIVKSNKILVTSANLKYYYIIMPISGECAAAETVSENHHRGPGRLPLLPRPQGGGRR